MEIPDGLILAAAQPAPVAGDFEANIQNHAAFVDTAARHRARIVVFPELSLSGYEPTLAADLAVPIDDARFDLLQKYSRTYGITIVAGAPMINSRGKPFIGAICFDSTTRYVYLKQHLHPGEEKYFSNGCQPGSLDINGVRVGLAICADITQPSHAEEAAGNGAAIYAASVFLTPTGHANDTALLKGYAIRHQMGVIMANYCALSGGIEASGKSTIWDNTGQVIVEGHENKPELIIAETSSNAWSGKVMAL